MTGNPDLRLWLLVWLVAASFVIYRTWRTGHGVGLVLSYVASFAALHWLASLVYLVPWYTRGDPFVVAAGMRLSAIGMVAFAVGSELVTWLRLVQTDDEESVAVQPTAATAFIVVGVFLHAVVLPAGRFIPSVTALATTGSTFFVAGICLKCWNAWNNGEPGKIWLWVLASLILPIVTVTTQGYLGYGMAALVIIMAFIAAFYVPRWRVVAVGVLLAYIGMSVYVTYMRDRSHIRELVWGGAAISDRTNRVVTTLTQIEWFDPSNEAHLTRVDERLNQNILVGIAMNYVGEGVVPFARGATVYEAVLSLVPRALWPNKPVTAGSGELVSIYTGLTFGNDTSVGIGHVMEWYVNFDVIGVVGGFMLMGLLLTLVDRSAAVALHGGDAMRFALWFLPGVSLLNIGGSFVEATSSAGAALIMASLIGVVLRHLDVTARFPVSRLETPSSHPEFPA